MDSCRAVVEVRPFFLVRGLAGSKHSILSSLAAVEVAVTTEWVAAHLHAVAAADLSAVLAVEAAVEFWVAFAGSHNPTLGI